MRPMNRRSFVIGTSATLAMPSIARATGAPALAKRQIQNLSRLDNRIVRRAIGALDTTYSQLTFASLWGFDAPFDYVRFHYANVLNSTVGLIASVAPSSAANDGFTPVGASLANVTFNALAVSAPNSEAPPGFPPGSAGTATAATLPVGVSANVPSWAASDWMAVSPLAPTDGSLYWLMGRTYLSSAYTGASVPYYANYKAALGPRAVRAFYHSGDCVTIPANFAGPAEAGFILPGAVEVMSRQPGASLMTDGDSLSAGLGTASGIGGFGGLVCAQLSKPSLPVSWINNGWSGQTSANYLLNGKAAIDAFAPRIVIVAPFSPNDNGQNPTQASVDAAWRDAIALCEYAQGKGAIPVLWTPIPWNYGGAAEAARQSICARVRALGAAGALIIDMDAAVRDPAAPNQILASLVSTSVALHPNDAGQAAMAAAALPVVQQAIGLL